MPEYRLSSFGWNPYEKDLGITPNENGEFPLKDPNYGSINQIFMYKQDNKLGLQVTNFRIPGVLNTTLTFDEQGNAKVRLTTHHVLSVSLGEEVEIVRARFNLGTK